MNIFFGCAVLCMPWDRFFGVSNSWINQVNLHILQTDTVYIQTKIYSHTIQFIVIQSLSHVHRLGYSLMLLKVFQIFILGADNKEINRKIVKTQNMVPFFNVYTKQIIDLCTYIACYTFIYFLDFAITFKLPTVI